MRDVLRNEKKYLLTCAETLATGYRLEKVLIPDVHSTDGGYLVRSLYFDTITDTDLWEKLSGTDIRRKIRLRVYDPAADVAYLEMKQKQGEYQRKRSLEMTREDAEKLIRSDYGVLLKYRSDFADEMYAIMTARFYRPKVVIDYRRMAFAAKENNIRITFDSDISASKTNMNIFDPRLDMIPVLDSDRTVLEVKYNGFLLSYIKDSLSCVNRSEISVSKYVMARENI